MDPPSDGGSNYSGAVGTGGISSNQGYFPVSPAATPAAQRVLDCGNADADLQVTWSVVGTYGIFVGRWIDDNNAIQLWCDASGNFQLYKLVSGSLTASGPLVTSAVSNGDVIKLSVAGNVWKIYQNGSQVGGNITEAANNSGTKFGVGTYSNTLIRFDNLTVTPAGGGPLVAAVPIQVCTATAITIYQDGTNGSIAPTGGTAPYTYQWHVSATDPNFTPSGGTAIGGATSQNLTVSSPDTTLRFYKCVITDSAAASVTTVDAPGRLYDANIRVLFIGDSLYYNTPSGGNPPPTNFNNFAAYLAGRIHAVTIFNAGAPGSYTAYWLPSTDPNYLAWPDPGPPDTGGVGLLAWAKSNLPVSGPTYAIIRLGPNDAALHFLSAATYGSYLTTIVGNLTAAGCKVILNYPTFGRPAGSYGDAANKLMLAYQGQIDSLVNGTTVFAGDKNLWQMSAIVTGWRQGDIHPSAAGSIYLAEGDELALAAVMYPTGGTGVSGSRIQSGF